MEALSQRRPAEVAEEAKAMEMRIAELGSELARARQEADSLRSELQVCEEKFSKSFFMLPDPAALGSLADGRIESVNQAFCDFFGMGESKAVGKTLAELSLWADPEECRSIVDILRRKGGIKNREFRARSSKGERTCLYSGEVITVAGRQYVLGTVKDITDLKAALSSLKEKEDELSISLRQLAEMNEALKTLLSQSQEDTRKFERRVVANVEDLVMPYVRRLQQTVLSVDQRVYVNVVEQNLAEIVAPFMRQIGAKHENLTPREIEVANLVRMGTTSKEIAKLLSISKRAVEFHRDSLRKKLGLKKSKKNLRAYLAALA
ncbi:MAG: LuxR C-terminal-related transcriptional regulator [Thermodesulfobacteriota bacterium]